MSWQERNKKEKDQQKIEENKIKYTSKFMSLLLRHQPETIGLSLDENGWASIEDMVILSQGEKRPLTREYMLLAVENNNKNRFSVSEDGKFIRANQGHSVKVDVELEEKEPPKHLYHGSASRNVESIIQKGINSGTRQHVHLSVDEDTAFNVGSRHGKPVLLLIDAQQMHLDGQKFYLSVNGVWLTSHIKPRYIKQL